MSAPLQVARETLAGTPAWLVGGTIRDRLLGRPITDWDLAVAGDQGASARAMARRLGAAAFPLSGTFGAWRVAARDHAWHLDLMPLQGASIEEDLDRRDFTINAMAEPLSGGAVLDPHGGREDLRDRRLRMVGEGAFADDALRVLRLARLATELDLAPEPGTLAAARRHAGGLAGVAAERVFGELKHVLCSPDALRGLALMDETGATAVVLPELTALRGVEQSPYHHLDVHDHTMAVLDVQIALERDPGALLGDAGEAAAPLLAEPLADELTRGQALRFAALLHDAAKPATRAVTPDGRVTFIGHDAAGADLAHAILGRLRASARLRAFVAEVTRHHLRLGFLVHRAPVAARDVYRYLRATEPVSADVTILSVADRVATRGRRSEEAIGRHLALARGLLAEALRWRAAGRPRPPVRGDELARAVGVRGARIGALLEELAEAQYAGEVEGRGEALALAQRLEEVRAGGDAPA